MLKLGDWNQNGIQRKKTWQINVISICGLKSKGLAYFVLKNDLEYLQFWG